MAMDAAGGGIGRCYPHCPSCFDAAELALSANKTKHKQCKRLHDWPNMIGPDHYVAYPGSGCKPRCGASCHGTCCHV